MEMLIQQSAEVSEENGYCPEGCFVCEASPAHLVWTETTAATWAQRAEWSSSRGSWFFSVVAWEWIKSGTLLIFSVGG